MAGGIGGKSRDAAAVDQLVDEITKARAALGALQDASKAELFAKSPIAKAKADLAGLEQKFKDIEKARDRAFAGREYVLGIRGKFEAQQAKDDAKAAKEQAKLREHSASQVKSALGDGADALIGASVKLAAAAAATVAAGVAFGVHISDAQRKQEAGLARLTHAFGGQKRGVEQGEIAFAVTMSLAGEKGVAPEDALKKVKRLIDAKFGREATETIFRVAADIGAVRGEDKAEAFVSQLEALKRLDTTLKDQDRNRLKNWKAIDIERGQAQVAALASMGEAGIKSSEVLSLVARKGESLQQTMLRLRRGQIDIGEFSKALTKVAGQDVGGVAGKGLEAQFNKIKILGSQLFSGWDLSPIDKAGEIIEGMFKGAEGAGLKQAFSEAGQAAIDLLKPFQSAEGKKAIGELFHGIADAARGAAEVLHGLKGDIIEIVKVNAEQGKGSAAILTAGKILGKVTGLGDGEQVGVPGVNVQGKGFVTFEEHRAQLAREKAAAAREAELSGAAISDGMAKGVRDNAPKVAEAVRAAVGGAIEAGNQKAGIHSPSTVAAEQGKNYDLGWAKGIDDNAHRPAAAAGGLAERVARAGGATGGGVGASAPGGTGAGVYAPYAPVVTLGAGTTPEMESRVRSWLADDYANKFLPALRQALRDGRETLTP